MVNTFHMPPVGFGPGSQPSEEDGMELEYMPMPQDMRTYTPHVPEVELAPALAPALELLNRIAKAAARAGEGGDNTRFDLSGLDPANRALIAETMGEGEVAIRIHGIPAVAAQESVFAGVWVLKGAGLDEIEVGPAPALTSDRAFMARTPAQGDATPKAGASSMRRPFWSN